MRSRPPHHLLFRYLMRLIHHLEFRRLLAGYALSTVGDAGVRMLLVWITLEQRGTVAMSRVFIGSAAACIFGPLVGRYLDRYRVRDILSVTCLARFALMLTLAFINPQAVARYAEVFAFLSTLFSLAYGPALSKTIPVMFTADQMREANASTGVSFLIASAAGPILGGAILAHYGLSAACAVFAAIFLINTPLSYFITFPLPQANDGEKQRSGGYAEGFRLLAAMPAVLVLVALCVVLNFTLAPINVALAPLLLSFGAGPQSFGLISALFVVGAVGGNVLAGGSILKRMSWEQSVLGSLGVIALGLVAMGVSQSSIQAALSILLIGFALPLFQVPITTQLQRSVPPGNAGQVFATINSVTLFAAPLAAAGMGMLLKWVAPPLLFFGAATVCTAMCLSWAFFSRQAERVAPLDSDPIN